MLHVLEQAPQRAGRLADDTRQAMFAPQVWRNPNLAWGLGWGLEYAADQTYIWHWGENGIFQNFVIADLQTRSGLVILTNSGRGMKLYEWIVRAAMGHNSVAFLWL